MGLLTGVVLSRLGCVDGVEVRKFDLAVNQENLMGMRVSPPSLTSASSKSAKRLGAGMLEERNL